MEDAGRVDYRQGTFGCESKGDVPRRTRNCGLETPHGADRGTGVHCRLPAGSREQLIDMHNRPRRTHGALHVSLRTVCLAQRSGSVAGALWDGLPALFHVKHAGQPGPS